MGLSEQEIIRIAAEQAAKVTLETLKMQKKKAKGERRDWRLRNTRLLLEHLREFKHSSEKSIFDVRKVLETPQAERMREAGYSDQQIINYYLDYE